MHAVSSHALQEDLHVMLSLRRGGAKLRPAILHPTMQCSESPLCCTSHSLHAEGLRPVLCNRSCLLHAALAAAAVPQGRQPTCIGKAGTASSSVRG